MKVIERFLCCDGCGDLHGVDNRDWSFEKHRTEAASEGWTSKGAKDYCPGCVEFKKEHAQMKRPGQD